MTERQSSGPMVALDEARKPTSTIDLRPLIVGIGTTMAEKLEPDLSWGGRRFSPLSSPFLFLRHYFTPAHQFLSYSSFPPLESG